MLYMHEDGTIWIDDRPEPPELVAEWERKLAEERAEEMRRNKERYCEMELAANIAWLESKIAKMDAEMDAEGIEDALDWEKFPEYEKLLYALAERMLEQQKADSDAEIAAEVAEQDRLLSLVEIAEEAARSEIGAFGSSEPWFYGEPEMNVFGPDYSKGIWADEREFTEDEEFDAWNAAIHDIPERFFEVDWSM